MTIELAGHRLEMVRHTMPWSFGMETGEMTSYVPTYYLDGVEISLAESQAFVQENRSALSTMAVLA